MLLVVEMRTLTLEKTYLLISFCSIIKIKMVICFCDMAKVVDIRGQELRSFPIIICFSIIIHNLLAILL